MLIIKLTIHIDFRRCFRPFFVDPKTTQPTPHKLYYDLFSWLATQLAFSFTVAPFILLTLPASFLVWSRVYFYAIIGTALSTAFFASPAKPYLMKMVNERSAKANNEGLKHSISMESLGGKEPVLGLPADPSRDFDEAIEEAKAEIQARKRKGKERERGKTES